MDLIQPNRVNQVFGSDQLEELTHVHLRHKHLFIPAQHVAQVGRQRIQIAQMGVGDRMTLRLRGLNRSGNRAIGTAPAQRPSNLPCSGPFT